MRLAYDSIHMDGAAADDSAATSRDRRAGVVRPFHTRSGAVPASGFDPLSLFSAEPAPSAGKPAAAAPIVEPSRTPSARRSLSKVSWLLCGIVIGALAAIAAPHVRIPGRTPAAPPARIANVESKPPAASPETIDASHHEPAPAAPASPPVQPEMPAASSSTPSSARAAAPHAAAYGWVTIASPFDVEVFDGKSPVGGSGAKVMLAAGRHTVRLVNASLGYDERRAVSVAAGKIARITIDAPKTTIDINARPWADISIDGVDVGQTPLAHVPVSLGNHVVQFRHPQLGEQRRTITVTSRGPNRITADLMAK